MFTGLIEEVGSVMAVRASDRGAQLQIAAPRIAKEILSGDSIAVNGCCLTVTRLESDAFAADASRETLNVTTLGSWDVGTVVNLEKALCAGQALGGHYVSGHVDGIAQVTSMHTDARSTRVEFEVPANLARYIAKKGSACVDGVSLTVNEVGVRSFGVNLIPHTLEVTALKNYRVGTRVNLEVDIIARYLERLTQPL